MDISNFYDSIDLNRLETAIRAWCPGREVAINGLMMFLRTWNRGPNYSLAGKGIPMDLVGDASRVLANAYLYPFDANVRKVCLRNGWTFQRFADDMVVIVGSPHDEARATAMVSEELQRLSLNLNAAKVEYHSADEFLANWRFDLMDRLEQGDLEGALRALKDGNDFKRKSTHLKRLLGIIARTEASAALGPTVATMVDAYCPKTELNCNQVVAMLRFHPHPEKVLEEFGAASLGGPFTFQLAVLLQVVSRSHDLPTACHNQASLLRKKVVAHPDPVLRFACSRMAGSERAA